MKNKKLFAILTLVCFMFTLMPVAAFAADTNYAAVVEDYEVVDANAPIKVSVDAGHYYVFAEDSNGNVYKKLGTDNGQENSIVELSTVKGILTFKISTADTYKIYVVDKSTRAINIVTKYVDGEIDKNQAGKNLKEEASVVMLANEVTVKGASATYSIALVDTPETVVLEANSAFDTEKVYVKLLANGVKPVAGATLKVSTNSSAVDVDKTEVTTNAAGIASFEISASTAGKFKVYVEYGTKADATINVQAGALDPAVIKTVAEPTAPYALGEDINACGISFTVTDANGNAIETPVLGDGVAKVAVVEKPAASGLKASDFSGLAYDEDNGIYVLATADTFDAEGTYKFKVALNNGAYATAAVEVKEFQKPVALTLKYEQTAVELDGEAILDEVEFVDANGVTKNAKGEVVLSATGYAIDTFDATTGKVVVKDNEKYVGSKITVLAVSDKYNLVANAEIVVANEAVAVKYASTNADVAVNNTLYANVVDADGNKVALNTTAGAYSIQYIVLDKPADAKVAISTIGNLDVTKGAFKVSFTASEIGTYKVQTVVRYDQVNGVVKYYSGIEDITVGNNGFEDVVVMSIGSTEIVVNGAVADMGVAPVIENGRTFVPYRAGLEALGAVVNYDEATGAVTAELDDTVVVMTIGSTEYTVNGVAKSMDVAPFIDAAAGRTMVPVRFAAQAFGITVTPTYNNDGTTADVLFAN